MKKHLLWPVILTIIIAISLTIFIYNYYQSKTIEVIDVDNEIANLVKNDEQSTEKDLKTIIHESQKTVVQIEAASNTEQSIGSGFIYNNKGDIITNAHVVNDAKSIYVKTADAKTYPAALIGISEEKDIAVIRVPQLINRSSLPVDPLFEAEIGDDIIAVGSPLGFQNTVTTGIISGKNRSFSVDGFDYKDVYQISASITSGNSGGPLIHKKTGKIIAINTAGTKEGTIGFSIPLSKVIDLANMWSDNANNENLNFNGDTRSVTTIEPEQLRNDANYLVNYFFDNLSVRDYLNAYTLLGSQLQAKTSYQDFRNEYIPIINIKINDSTSKLLENKRVKFTLQTDNHIRKDNQTEVIEHYESQFIIGYENDQLKILESTRDLLSTTTLEPLNE